MFAIWLARQLSTKCACLSGQFAVMRDMLIKLAQVHLLKNILGEGGTIHYKAVIQ